MPTPKQDLFADAALVDIEVIETNSDTGWGLWEELHSKTDNSFQDTVPADLAPLSIPERRYNTGGRRKTDSK